MKVRYVGPIGGGIEVPHEGRYYETDADGVVDVPEVLGLRLLEQAANWQAVKTTVPKEKV